jgi:uncharacterized membrane-anchored protein YhcB (DUF1043 family)
VIWAIGFICFAVGVIIGILVMIMVQSNELEDEAPKTVRDKDTKGM